MPFTAFSALFTSASRYVTKAVKPPVSTIEHTFLAILLPPSYSTHTRPRKSRAYTRSVLVPTRADRPYGPFPPGHLDLGPHPGAPRPPQKSHPHPPGRRPRPWLAALAGPGPFPPL